MDEPVRLKHVADRFDYGGAGRSIPWQGGSARLVVRRPFYMGRTTVLADGAVVARPPRPTLAKPWIECELPGSRPSVNVVQVQTDFAQFMTLVFVDGVSLDDGMPIDVARSRAPVPLDGFEQRFFMRHNSMWLGLPGALVGGAYILFNVLDQPGPVLPKAAFGAAGAVIFAGWVGLAAVLARWLRGKRSWPSGLRTAILIFGFLGVPFLGIAGLVALSGGR